MTPGKKILGEERRTLILEWLQTSKEPLTGSELASRSNVSRQVIVNDITLLKARNEPIIATSQGYCYFAPSLPEQWFERSVACNHKPEETEEELNLLVDLGLLVKDVKIEHPVYGDLTASIMVSNRKEVAQFVKRIHETNATYLSQLTNGVHLHTIAAKNKQTLDEAEAALQEAGFLLVE
ncbi:transcription repressor NadR [Bacillus badius]|uniref:Transcriptional repressor for NAD biosynthesis n=1 Tax=Bacillus badius TaxID=1455 RepID=A0ABR5AT93_BACBA|nr:transcription repressor NadR [Bacillus badius]KIL75461.1 Transcriptional repressor for NAD biosynthesis [Bacillus badius]KIL77976.1 Transcriptional repressor for NAD biosynthesis [Bacillus badius]KZN98697.1 transcriptional regulator [Bacillus badius]MED0666314.1 transcription repressor NadR [Bacillus badius]MED4716407.1 transcription repressor NadR [Bacillus badius]